MTITSAVRARVIQQAENRCGYCLVPAGFIYASMEVDHIVLRAAGGSDDEANLWLPCPRCNGFKGAQTDAFDLRTGHLKQSRAVIHVTLMLHQVNAYPPLRIFRDRWRGGKQIVHPILI